MLWPAASMARLRTGSPSTTGGSRVSLSASDESPASVPSVYTSRKPIRLMTVPLAANSPSVSPSVRAPIRSCTVSPTQSFIWLARVRFHTSS